MYTCILYIHHGWMIVHPFLSLSRWCFLFYVVVLFSILRKISFFFSPSLSQCLSSSSGKTRPRRGKRESKIETVYYYNATFFFVYINKHTWIYILCSKKWRIFDFFSFSLSFFLSTTTTTTAERVWLRYTVKTVFSHVSAPLPFISLLFRSDHIFDFVLSIHTTTNVISLYFIHSRHFPDTRTEIPG